MTDPLSHADIAKFTAARRAIDFVEDGMRLGLGTGSTANWMVRCLAARARREGLRLICVPTSSRTARLAHALGLTVVPLDQAGWLDLTIDGADEFDPAFDLIKGGGGAHLQEKIVASASDRMVVIADAGKAVDHLGAFPLPVEVLSFGLVTTRTQIDLALAAEGYADAEMHVRASDGTDFVTDEGNRIIDLHLERITDSASLSDRLLRIPGVMETGLFLGLCDTVVIGNGDGVAEIRRKGAPPARDRVDPADAAHLPDAE